MVKCLATAAGLTGKFTNHSLRATAASRMYQDGVPEKFIKEITGHKSDVVCCYEHTSDSMKRKVSATMSNPNFSVNQEEKPDEVDLTEDKVECSKTFKKLCPDIHPLLQCMQSSGINEIVNSIPGKCMKSVKVQVEIECKEKWNWELMVCIRSWTWCTLYGPLCFHLCQIQCSMFLAWQLNFANKHISVCCINYQNN